MSIERRVVKAEERLNLTREVGICPPVIVGHCGRQPTAEDERRLGPVKGWATYQEQLQAQEAANAERQKDHPGCPGCVIEIDLDVDAESQARRGYG